MQQGVFENNVLTYASNDTHDNISGDRYRDELPDRLAYCNALGADCQPVRCVLHVATCNELPSAYSS